VSRWNDSTFWIDPTTIRWSTWQPIERLIHKFVQQSLMIEDKGGKSRLLVMHPEFRKALGEELKRRTEAE
jgi:hypothetical protein